MGYYTGDDLIVTAIKTHDSFDNDNVAQAKWGVLNSGESDHYAITRDGGTTPEFLSPSIYVAHRSTIVEVWQRYKDDGTSAENLSGYVENIFGKLQDKELLADDSNVIQNSEVQEIGPVEEMWSSGGGPAWLRQNITVAWEEQVTAS